ncbi:hypothetical protein FRC11_001385, partial [Ceratobasidium sp. 423]
MARHCGSKQASTGGQSSAQPGGKLSAIANAQGRLVQNFLETEQAVDRTDALNTIMDVVQLGAPACSKDKTILKAMRGLKPKL